MLKHALLLAAADPIAETLRNGAPTKIFGLSIRDASLLLGAAIIIMAALFLWAYLTRRRRQRETPRLSRVIERGERHVHKWGRDGRRYRKRRKRSNHADFRPRNPTLGETGGLPPIRPDEPAQPAH